MKKIFCIIIILLLITFVGCNNKIDEEYEDLKTKYEELQNQKEELINEINDYKEEYSELENKYNMNDDKYNELSNKYNELINEYNDLLNELNISQTHVDQLEKEYNELNNDYENIVSNYDILENEKNELKQNYENALDKIDSYENVERYKLNKYVQNIKKLYYNDDTLSGEYMESSLVNEILFAIHYDKICAWINIKDEGSVYVCKYYDKVTREEKWALYNNLESISRVVDAMIISEIYLVRKAVILKDIITNEYINFEFSLYDKVGMHYPEDENKFIIYADVIKSIGNKFMDFILQKDFNELNSNDNIIDRCIKFEDMIPYNEIKSYEIKEYNNSIYIKLLIGPQYPFGDIINYVEHDFIGDLDLVKGKIIFDDLFKTEFGGYYVLFSLDNFKEYYNYYVDKIK